MFVERMNAHMPQHYSHFWAETYKLRERNTRSRDGTLTRSWQIPGLELQDQDSHLSPGLSLSLSSGTSLLLHLPDGA